MILVLTLDTVPYVKQKIVLAAQRSMKMLFSVTSQTNQGDPCQLHKW